MPHYRSILVLVLNAPKSRGFFSSTSTISLSTSSAKPANPNLLELESCGCFLPPEFQELTMLGLYPDIQRLSKIRFIVCIEWLLIFTGLGTCAMAQFPADHFDRIDPASAVELKGTERLTLQGDIASELVSGVDRFLLKQIDAAVIHRLANWPKPNSQNNANTPEIYEESIKGLRAEYSRRIGLADSRTEPNDWIIESHLGANGLATGLQSLASDESIRIEQVRWPVLEGFEAHGLLVIPRTIRFGAVLVPDASQLPENLCGVGQHANADALAVARCGGLVVIPQGASRHREARLGRAIMTDQEYLYRSAFILGRHLLGYHVHQNMAAVDLLKKTIGQRPAISRRCMHALRVTTRGIAQSDTTWVCT